MMKTIKEPGRSYYLAVSMVAVFVSSVMYLGGVPSSETSISQNFINLASAATSSSVTVSATVGTSVSCSTDNSSTAFGTLTSSAIATSTPNASSTMTTNDGLGLTFYVNDAGNGTNGGLSTSSPAYIIPSPASGYPATASLTAGTEGYGVQATTTAAGSNGTLGVASSYNSYNSATVGKLATSTQIVASSTSAVTGREIVVKHKAAVSVSTQAATYTDTITYTCLGN